MSFLKTFYDIQFKKYIFGAKQPIDNHLTQTVNFSLLIHSKIIKKVYLGCNQTVIKSITFLQIRVRTSNFTPSIGNYRLRL